MPPFRVPPAQRRGVVTDARGAKATSWYWGRTRVGDHSIVFAQVLGTVGGGPIMPVATIFMLARGTRISYDDDVTALSVTPLSGDAGQGVAVEWKSNLGGIHLTLPSPKEIANLNKGGYRRYLSLAVLRSDFDGEAFSGQGHGIWEINVLA